MATQWTAAEMAARLRAREISALELCEAHLARIKELDGTYEAFLYVDEEGARAQAQAAQDLIDSGDGGPLAGVPVALKDNLSTRGVPTTCASRILEGYRPVFDATVVRQLREEGLVMLGKTNLDEFAMGTSGENSAFRVSRNPWDAGRVPGGSSSGSATAVGTEMAPLSLGSDTGGSIRMPAAMSGIVGFKPTYGRVSRYGLIAFGSSLDQIGPFGRTVEDTAMLAQAISGHDPLDSTSLPDSKIRLDELKSCSLKGLRLGIPEQLVGDSVDPSVGAALEAAIETLQKEGVEVRKISLPSISVGVTTYYIIAPAEASSNLARFDGIRFGPQCEGDGHIGNVAVTRGRLFGHEVKLRIMVGTYALSAGYYDAYYHRAQQVRGLMVAEFEREFGEVDAVVSAGCPVPAFPAGGYGGDPLALKMLDLCTIPANMGGFPSISVPCGLVQGLPVGLLLTAPVNEDERLLKQAYAIEQAFGPYRRPPLP
ncbi:MAG: Asp-tRNA(Asn)/Glu-tRNA(Gln) amidotransferase subunit GatA [Fimbriimonadaceae bacterium]|nr:Asp-tRNA(Asn)/Glu-tRNA(Gln) amidotransferase subunit GatA [Fimbriimonadaceae bacterium]QYK55949.1 MAG: Asp-tRNA(Asn)/Glu-tRNA(Gln) amidotransferase subunit GatA [Fimbriimonadaceae bacterium]